MVRMYTLVKVVLPIFTVCIYVASLVYVRKYICSQPKDSDHDICVVKNSREILGNKNIKINLYHLINFS